MSGGRTPTTNPLRVVTGRRENGAPSLAERDPRQAPGSESPPEGSPGGNLPLELSSFVGREREISEVESILSEARLLTLVGPGGCGKTRLALRVAADLGRRGNPRELFGDGVWWVGLDSLSDPGLTPNAVASALGVRETPDRVPTEALAVSLEAKKALLVLDNGEHLVGACAALADFLLRSCPGVKLLATSREPPGVPGEVSWPVPPLTLPNSGDIGQERDAAGLLRSGATRLFVERARAASPGFDPTWESALAVAGLCAWLDGMPLAIELAAARTRTLSPGQILERLDDSFRLLRGGRASVERHRTLGATIDWSHDLLSEEEKAMFRRLSVFVGGFSLEASEEVCAGGSIGKT